MPANVWGGSGLEPKVPEKRHEWGTAGPSNHWSCGYESYTCGKYTHIMPWNNADSGVRIGWCANDDQLFASKLLPHSCHVCGITTCLHQCSRRPQKSWVLGNTGRPPSSCHTCPEAGNFWPSKSCSSGLSICFNDFCWAKPLGTSKRSISFTEISWASLIWFATCSWALGDQKHSRWSTHRASSNDSSIKMYQPFSRSNKIELTLPGCFPIASTHRYFLPYWMVKTSLVDG